MTAGVTLPDMNISAINAPSTYHMKSTYSCSTQVSTTYIITGT